MKVGVGPVAVGEGGTGVSVGGTGVSVGPGMVLVIEGVLDGVQVNVIEGAPVGDEVGVWLAVLVGIPVHVADGSGVKDASSGVALGVGGVGVTVPATSGTIVAVGISGSNGPAEMASPIIMNVIMQSNPLSARKNTVSKSYDSFPFFPIQIASRWTLVKISKN